MSAVYIISDTHFGHENIPYYRPMFSSAEEHDGIVLDNILTKVNKRDTLWMLGDCFFEPHTMDYAIRISNHVNQLNFIPGNHDTDTPARATIFIEMVQKGLFHRVGSMFRTKEFWLTHAPIHTNELFGRINVHGHVHRKTVKDERYINVSAENINFTPVAVQALANPALRTKLLTHYGEYEHECKDFSNNKGTKCLICDMSRHDKPDTEL